MLFDINPYEKPLLSIVRSENELWEKQRIQWDKNLANNERCEINARVIFVFDKRLVALQNEPYAYLIDAGTIARIIMSKNRMLLRLELFDAAFANDGFFCYFLTGFCLGDILPGFLRLASSTDVRTMVHSVLE